MAKLFTSVSKMVVAWRINRLMRLGRNIPDLEALLFFDGDEIRAVSILQWADTAFKIRQ